MKKLESYYIKIKSLEISKLWISRYINLIPSKYYFYLVLIIGTIIRLRQYLANRSFWIDEAALAINIRDRDYSQLLEALEYQQIAPIGFLYLEKYLTSTFGHGEMVYRLFPLLASIASIWLLYKLCMVVINKEVALISSFLFIISTILTYFSSELKQYSSDIFFGLLILWVWHKLNTNKTVLRSLSVGVVGAIGLWFSNVLVIVLSSIGLVNLVYLIFNRKLKPLLNSIPEYLLWAISFSINYYYFIFDHPHSEGMKKYWASKFMVTDSFTESVEWIWYSLATTFSDSIGFYQAFRVPLFLFFGGVVISVFTHRKRLIFFFPIIIHFILSGIKIYPYDTRLVLYLIPFYLIFVSISIDYISKIRFLKRANILVSIIIIYSITGVYLSKAKDYFATPNMREHIRPTLSYIKQKMKKDDTLYVYYGSLRPFRFYAPMMDFTTSSIIMGRYPNSLDENFKLEISRLNGRVWILFSHLWPPDGIEYIDNQIIRKDFIDYYETTGSKVYLVNIPTI